MTLTTLLLLVGLEFKHYLFDFVYQTPYQLRNKGIYGHPGGLLHSGLHAAGTFLLLVLLSVQADIAAFIAAGEFVAHYHLDWAKEQVARFSEGKDESWFWRMTGLDQFLHHVTYVAVCAIALIANS
ncbi:DUF3307 domain-containing protein [Chelativorans sp. YIM 93263]|uniref:DUF3307 domain-containing protein n=1 Tax=Chelativorans sp. YIM 93263 TaxID=2906648 RepID=UPI002377D2E2|nr:DUF3307 domain-containing protein [Chelativorans sp. YIM 93263]